MEPVRVIRSRTVVIPSENIDTDQIIPARFLTTTSRSGLGQHLFADKRFDADGKPRPEFPLNRPEAAGCSILVAGRNFGCGSSREHAPWALHDYGFRAVVSTEIADIFRSNALRNGLLPVVVGADIHQWLMDNPGAEVTVDLEARRVGLPDGRFATFEVEAFARYCLLEGIDPLGFLMGRAGDIRSYEERRAWTP
ncbi:MAG: 3-isopropylmalate dehydratase small subunit [Gammaproteobacteria bacterium]